MPDAGASKSKSNDYDFDILVVGGTGWSLLRIPFRKMGLSIKY